MKATWIALTLFLLAAMSSTEQSDIVRQIDFGPQENAAEGCIAIADVSNDARFLWTGKALGVRDRGGADKVNSDFIFGREGKFLLGLDNGGYEVELVLGDLGYPQGPFSVFAQGELVIQEQSTRKGRLITKTFPAKVTEERLSLEFVAAEDAPFFAVASMIVRGKKQSREYRVWPDSPSESIPTLAELEAAGEFNPRTALQCRRVDGTARGSRERRLAASRSSLGKRQDGGHASGSDRVRQKHVRIARGDRGGSALRRLSVPSHLREKNRRELRAVDALGPL